MIHQHFMLVPTLTVTENVALGLGRNPFTGVDLPGIARRITELSNTYHLGIDPEAKCWQLAVGERQRVEILKVLYRRARLLVLDEPTAVLTPGEVDELLGTLRRIADDGCGLIFISHKLHEALDFADRITVMRDGAVTGEVLPADTSVEQLAQLMVGRPVKLVPDKSPSVPGAAVLAVSDLTVAGDRRSVAVSANWLTRSPGCGPSCRAQCRSTGSRRRTARRTTLVLQVSPMCLRNECARARSGTSACGRTSSC